MSWQTSQPPNLVCNDGWRFGVAEEEVSSPLHWTQLHTQPQHQHGCCGVLRCIPEAIQIQLWSYLKREKKKKLCSRGLGSKQCFPSTAPPTNCSMGLFPSLPWCQPTAAQQNLTWSVPHQVQPARPESAMQCGLGTAPLSATALVCKCQVPP